MRHALLRLLSVALLSFSAGARAESPDVPTVLAAARSTTRYVVLVNNTRTPLLVQFIDADIEPFLLNPNANGVSMVRDSALDQLLDLDANSLFDGAPYPKRGVRAAIPLAALSSRSIVTATLPWDLYAYAANKLIDRLIERSRAAADVDLLSEDVAELLEARRAEMVADPDKVMLAVGAEIQARIDEVMESGELDSPRTRLASTLALTDQLARARDSMLGLYKVHRVSEDALAHPNDRSNPFHPVPFTRWHNWTPRGSLPAWMLAGGLVVVGDRRYDDGWDRVVRPPDVVALAQVGLLPEIHTSRSKGALLFRPYLCAGLESRTSYLSRDDLAVTVDGTTYDILSDNRVGVQLAQATLGAALKVGKGDQRWFLDLEGGLAMSTSASIVSWPGAGYSSADSHPEGQLEPGRAAFDDMVRASSTQGLAERGYLGLRVGGVSDRDGGVYATFPSPLWGLSWAADLRVTNLPGIDATESYAITTADGAPAALPDAAGLSWRLGVLVGFSGAGTIRSKASTLPTRGLR